VLHEKTGRLHYPALLLLEEGVDLLLKDQDDLEKAGSYRNGDEARGLAPRILPRQ
jgi:hypothetical protein